MTSRSFLDETKINCAVAASRAEEKPPHKTHAEMQGEGKSEGQARGTEISEFGGQYECGEEAEAWEQKEIE